MASTDGSCDAKSDTTTPILVQSLENDDAVREAARDHELWNQLEKEEPLESVIRKVVENFKDVFAVSDSELGKTHLTECVIKLKEGVQPIKQKPRPIPLAI
uniref:Uncharacterized protein n=1 Tax=Caenorhabditis japonica TaxID=281687 RepID=A0A8R1IXB9_CAEJA